MLAQFSDALAALARATTPRLIAVRADQNRHVTGLRWQNDLVLTVEQDLPASPRFALVLPRSGGLVAGEALQRTPGSGLAAIGLNRDGPVEPPREANGVATGQIVMLVAAAFDASAAVRLTAIHRAGPVSGDEQASAISLDIPPERAEPGSIVVDMAGGIVGLTTTTPAGDVVVIPYETLREFADRSARMAEAELPDCEEREGWLGIAVQPTTLPGSLRDLVGQSSGRMVVDIAPNGPADTGGLQVGDVLLALDGQAVSGPHAFRSVLASERIGHRLEVTLVRNGSIHIIPVVVAAHPRT